MKRLLLILGVLLIVAAGAWKFGFSQPWTNRYSDQWSWQVKTIGQSGYPDETGKYPEGTTLKDDPINLTTRDVTADAADSAAGTVLISDHYESRDTVTNELTWEYISTATVDARDGRYAEGELSGDYYFFPRNVDKNAAYTISNSSYKSLPMTFQREEAVAGVNTYLFAFHGDFDNTAANEAFVTLEPGQKVICFDFSLEYWVEPVTGEIVKYREWCEGDWIVNEDTNERISTVSRWGAETSGDDIIRQVTNVQNKKVTYLWVSLYGPLAALGLGIALVAFDLLRLFGKSGAKAS
jgi:hypothetical protein